MSSDQAPSKMPEDVLTYLREGPGKDASFDERFAWMKARREAGFAQETGVSEVTVEWELKTNLRVDLPGLIKANRVAYHLASLDDLEVNEEWERPVGWLHFVLSEDVAPDFGNLSGGFRFIKSLMHDFPEVDVAWTPRDYEELLAVCPEARRLPDGSSPVQPSWRGEVPLPLNS